MLYLRNNNNNNSKDQNLNNNVGNNKNKKNNNSGGLPCHNSQRLITHIFRPQINTWQDEMKIWLLQILYVNLFTGLDHEYPYTHLTKIYELYRTLGEAKEERSTMFMRLFPIHLLEKQKNGIWTRRHMWWPIGTHWRQSL